MSTIIRTKPQQLQEGENLESLGHHNLSPLFDLHHVLSAELRVCPSLGRARAVFGVDGGVLDG